MYEVCNDLDIKVIGIECHIDYTHIFFKYSTTINPSDIMARIKGVSSRKSSQEFKYLNRAVSLWSCSFFVFTAGNASSDTIKKYIDKISKEYIKTVNDIVPVIIEGKSKRIAVKTKITDYQKNILENSKLTSLRITKKSNKWIAQISVEILNKEKETGVTMGIDLGLKVPAVAVTENRKTKFFGNGRENKYIKCKFRSKRKQLGKAKKINAIRKLNNKEQRWMKDKDHKVSREIINFAKQNNVSLIRLEQLTNIRNTARTSRKNEKNLHTWSFYRLAQFIGYKANLEGIEVEYVNPKNTSKKCPRCGKLNHAKDRKYSCKCGYKAHRDRIGEINIINAIVRR